MTDQKKMLLDWIDQDREALIDFLSGFIQAKSPSTRPATPARRRRI
jgi:hypothetical protein